MKGRGCKKALGLPVPAEDVYVGEGGVGEKQHQEGCVWGVLSEKPHHTKINNLKLPDPNAKSGTRPHIPCAIYNTGVVLCGRGVFGFTEA